MVAMGVVEPGGEEGFGAVVVGQGGDGGDGAAELRAIVRGGGVGEAEEVQAAGREAEEGGGGAGFLFAEGAKAGRRVGWRVGVGAGTIGEDEDERGAAQQAAMRPPQPRVSSSGWGARMRGVAWGRISPRVARGRVSKRRRRWAAGIIRAGGVA